MAKRGLILESTISAIEARVRIADVLQSNGITPPGNPDKGNIKCPVRPDQHRAGDKSPSFSVFDGGTACYCHACKFGGTAVALQMELTGESFPEAVESLAGMAGIEVQRENSDKPDPNAAIRKALSVAAEYYASVLPRSPQAAAYAAERGFNQDHIARISLGYAPNDYGRGLKEAFREAGVGQKAAIAAGLLRESTRKRGELIPYFFDRLMFPVRDAYGEIIAFGGRRLADVTPEGEPVKAPKYYNSPETRVFHKGNVLYNLDQAKRAAAGEGGRVYVFEGYMDVEAYRLAGKDNAVAAMGTAFTSEQMQLLSARATEIVLCFDDDEPGRKAAWGAVGNILPALSADTTVRIAILPEGQDPDDVISNSGLEGFERQMESALSVDQYLIRELEKKNVGGLQGMLKMADEAAKVLANIPDPLLHALLVKEVAKSLEIDPQIIADRMGDHRKAPTYTTQSSAHEGGAAPAATVPKPPPAREGPTAKVPDRDQPAAFDRYSRRRDPSATPRPQITPEQIFRSAHAADIRVFRAKDEPGKKDIHQFIRSVLLREASYMRSGASAEKVLGLVDRFLRKEIATGLTAGSIKKYTELLKEFVDRIENRGLTYSGEQMDATHTKPKAAPRLAGLEQKKRADPKVAAAPGR